MATTTMKAADYVRPFDQLSIDDVALVGGKNASLGEMIRELRGQGIRVPDGFATTAHAFRFYFQSTGLHETIRELLTDLDHNDIEQLQLRGLGIRHAILETPIPDALEQAILDGYEGLCRQLNSAAAVAVRSSATAEDLPDASFAGQQETFLNITGKQPLLNACQQCFASLFTDRAIAYRIHQGFDHLDVALSIGIQHMVRADTGSSGVLFTIDTETGFSEAVLINASYGLGENVVKGTVNPDEYFVFKPTLKQGFRPILQKKLGTKEFKMVCSSGGSQSTRNVPVSLLDRNSFALDDNDILQLARWGCEIEEHYSRKHGRFVPMDIEWARDGETGELYVLQARPETVQSQKTSQQIERFVLRESGAKTLVSGNAIGQKIASGNVHLIRSLDQLTDFREGEVLVAEKTDPDWEPVMKKAAAIVTNHGGRTCHAAIVARELGLPAVVGTNNATEMLQPGQAVTISCAQGELGVVLDGLIPFDVEHIDLEQVPSTRTRLMVNIANPQIALAMASLPVDGVGLARLEFTISNYVRVHPLALLNYSDLDQSLQEQIDGITVGYDDRVRYFVDRLAHGVAMIAAAFYPRDVIVRMSDFKSNEYAGLVGGAGFEPDEENPMIGFRGASRYYDPRYREGFGLECQAMKKVRDDMGLTNVKLMIPFCRTPEEGRKVIDEMERHGLVRGDHGLEIYVMCEIPSNVILAEDFAELFDGFSIGSNDLTQLTLGIDRDSELVAHLFDERSPAVETLVKQVIQTGRQCDCRVGICGQAPSDFPEFTRFLVDAGIDSISVIPDVALKTKLIVAAAEQELDQVKYDEVVNE
ncbi:MAG: phosphoenolpyruvate synthase [Pirellulaceae bacterium]